MSESNIPLTTEKTYSKIKFNKTIYEIQDEFLEYNQADLNNIHPSQNNSKKNNSEKQLQFELKTENNAYMSGPIKGEKDSEKQLLYYFQNKKIYIEIYNGNLNANQTFLNLLLKYKIIQCKKLSKKIDYIIFKDGHLKTKKYAVLNNIKMVNPLWIDDKINKHIFKDDKEYEIKTNFGEILLRENYEINNNDENNEGNVENKNYELELEAEYDTEYANLIDKIRESGLQKNNYSEMTNCLTNDGESQNNINETKESKKNSRNENIEIIKRKKRKTKYSNKSLENRQTFINDKNNEKNIKNDDNKSSKRNSRNHKKVQKKIKKNQFVNETEKKEKKNIDKKKNNDENKNYILEFNQNSDKILSLPKQNEIKLSSEKAKINIMTYKLESKEIQCLRTLNNFEYKGNLNNNEDDEKIYNNASIIIVEQKKVIYDWKLYEFLLDKKIIVDFTSFLLEFINRDISDNNDSEILIEKINEISVNNEFYFFNKKKRIQKRTILQSLNIIDNIIIKDKKDQNYQQQNYFENKFYFMINQDIKDNEKKIFQKLLKNYLKANIINTNMPKNCYRSASSQINLKMQKMSKKKKFEANKENILLRDYENTKENNLNIIKNLDKNNKDDNILNNNITEFKNETQKKTGTYLISKDKPNNIKFLNKVKYYKGIISYKYIYDSFINGQLLDLNEKEIFEKYKLE